MNAVTHLEKVITGEVSAVTYTEKVLTGEAPPITHLQKVIAGEASPVTHLEHIWAGRTPEPTEHEYTGVVPYTFNADGTPLLDWYIKGNTVQSTTPTPQNPIMPSECGERTVNLFDEKYPSISPTIQYMPMFVGDGTFTLSSTTPQMPNGAACLFLIAGNVSSGAGPQNKVYNEQSITVDSSNGYITIAYRIVSDYDPRNYTTMLNTGSTALPYEPYGYFIEIEVS